MLARQQRAVALDEALRRVHSVSAVVYSSGASISPARAGPLAHTEEGSSAIVPPPGHCGIISPPSDEILHRHPGLPASSAHAATTSARGGMGWQMPSRERSRPWLLG